MQARVHELGSVEGSAHLQHGTSGVIDDVPGKVPKGTARTGGTVPLAHLPSTTVIASHRGNSCFPQRCFPLRCYLEATRNDWNKAKPMNIGQVCTQALAETRRQEQDRICGMNTTEYAPEYRN